MQLLDRIFHHATDTRLSLAIRNAEDGVACTYGELARRIESMAGLLRQRLPRGAVVILKCPNCPDFWVAYFAVLAAEMSVFPVPPDLALPELIRAAERSSAAAILIDPGSPRPQPFALEALAGEMSLLSLSLYRRNGDTALQPGPGLLLQSSGTTGEPKIV
jgi:acyl-CoA synthetase (AMP-forming)/AMP-acid ligase II